MDASIRTLIRAIESGAYVLSSQEQAMLSRIMPKPEPIQQAAPEWDRDAILRRAEALQDSNMYSDRLPALRFSPNWKVKILPPRSGALIQFRIFGQNGQIVEVIFASQRFGRSAGEWLVESFIPETPSWYVFGIADSPLQYGEREQSEMMERIKLFLKG